MAATSKKFLSVVVVRAMNLTPKDPAIDSKFRRSDPYCILRVAPHGKTKRTRVIRRNLNPVWNHRFSLGYFDDKSALRVTCWDRDLFTSDDLIGEVSIPLANYFHIREPVVDWFKIQDNIGSAAGEIQLKFIVTIEKPKKSRDAVLSRSELPPIEVKKKLVFGVSLENALQSQKQKHPDLKVPFIVHECIRVLKKHLSSEGVFRHSGSQAVMQNLIQKLDEGESVSLESVPVDSVANILKQYFRHLPTPLLTYDIYKAVADAPNEIDDNWLNSLQLLIAKIPKYNFEVASALFELLYEVSAHSEENKMTPTNIGVVIGPSVLWEPPGSPILPSVYEKIASIVAIMVEQYTFFFQPRENESVSVGTSSAKLQQSESLALSTGRHLFYMYDTSRNGVLDREEFGCFYRDLLGESATDEEIQEAMAILDKNGDNEISLKEFLSWWKSSGKAIVRAAHGYKISHARQ